MTAAINSSFSRVYSPSLGLPGTPNYNNFVDGNGSFGIRNSFIGPQVGFNAEQHWGRYWVASENKLAVGAMIEDVSVSGSSVTSTTPTTTLLLAGVPIAVNGGAPASGAGGAPAFGLFAQTNRSRTEFAVVPSGNIKLGYDINESVSLTLAYNYLYMSTVGRVGGPGFLALGRGAIELLRARRHVRREGEVLISLPWLPWRPHEQRKCFAPGA
jgi:hypothetical protein